MPLVPFDPNHQWNEAGRQPVLVFADGDRSMGLVVDEIVDVVADVISVELSADEPGLIGSAIIGGKAMDIVDAGTYVTQAYANWFATEPTRETAPKNGQRHALIVDANPFVRDLLTPHLAGAGWRVVSAESGAEASRLIESDSEYGIVVAGLDTPGFDAAAFARKLRAHPRGATVKLAAVSQIADDDEFASLCESGFDICVAKSDWSVLIDELRALATDTPRPEATTETGAGAQSTVTAARKKAARVRRVTGRDKVAA
jgi:two-component system chemotaxis sensor kinase CheA